MWHRSAVVVAAVLLFAASAPAQVRGVYSRAIPPDKAALERLNLKIEWTAYIPVEGRRDTLTQIQTIDDQIFVQTRTGLLIAGDALTGRLQWVAQLGNSGYANTYPVAANSQLVFVANVTTLYAFHRYTGVTEFVVDLGSPPTVGLAADETGVYCVLGMRSGNSGAHRVAVYNLPRPLPVPAAPKGPTDPNKPPVKDPKAVNPVDELMQRYAPQGMYRTNLPDVFDPANRPNVLEAPTTGFTGSSSPSLATLERISPPYTLDRGLSSYSLAVLPSLRQPYRLRNDFQRDIQQTPSIGTIPPSVAAALALSDLRPRNIEPQLRWEFALTTRILYPPFLTPTRVWVATDGQILTALNKTDKKIEVMQRLADPISAYPGRAGLIAYVPLATGDLVAVEGASGNLSGGANILWRTPTGGINNRTPFVTEKLVYAQGDNSGITCLDRTNGELLWRTDSTADLVIAANHEFLYVRDRQGRFLVYDAKRATDPARKRSAPLSGLDLGDFNINVVNTASDRIFLAADNGLIVCLRDLSPKYERPVRISPEPIVNAPRPEPVGTTTPKENKDNPEPR
jgi:outer membrane protein assembly factor BamB